MLPYRCVAHTTRFVTGRYEAFHQTGWERTKTCIHDLRKAADDIYEANYEDDLVDDDDDGVA